MRNRRTAAIVTGFVTVAIIVGQLATSAGATTGPLARGSLTGTWSGTYRGAYHGSFTLHWTQSKSRLTGTIKLSSAGGPVGLKGSVRGGSIKFGTVGGPAITYSGSASGRSMSGRYQTPGGGGSWSAHRL